MRSRSNSGVRLDYYYRIVQKTILQHQDPVSGLLPASADYQHAWVRDNLYSILAVWGLSMAYKKNADLDEDRAKTYELEMSCVKLMRALLTSMMLQKDKIEKFKWSQAPKDALHAKYCARTGLPVVGDMDWGHLQIDATSLFLLVLAQMTASGLQICYNLDEVSLIQNLVFYIESAYCIPDYGIWERGDKTNHGLPELNASSIGLAKAALEAMNELDLFGARGGPASVIHVLADEAHKCQAVLQSMLPRESSSKEVDSGLMGVISFPAFAVDDPELIKKTRHTILTKLRGKYGCKRFLWDGYKTPKEVGVEDPNRLYYEPRELKMFENIECEWPLFFCYLILDAQFQNDKTLTQEYGEQLDKMLVTSEDGLRLVPEMYTVPADRAELEYKKPGSQERVVAGRMPFMWAQSLYIVGRLLQDNFLACGELDPLNRRLGSEKKPDVVVQVVLLAEDAAMQSKLAAADIHVQTIAEVAPIEVQPARVLSKLYAHLGRNQKLGLSGRQSLDVGILSTSKLYCLQDRVFAFTPQFMDHDESYLPNDIDLGLFTVCIAVATLGTCWRDLGRPTVSIVVRRVYLDEDDKVPTAMVATVKKLNSGYINGTRVALGKMADFLNTSCMTSLNFLHDTENGYPDSLKPEVKQYLSGQMRGSLAWRRSDLVKMSSSKMESISEDVPTEVSAPTASPPPSALVPPLNLRLSPRKEDNSERFSRQVGSARQNPLARRKISVNVKGSIRKSRSVFGEDGALGGKRHLSNIAEEASLTEDSTLEEDSYEDATGGEEAACSSRRESGGTLASPSVSNPASAGNTLTYGSSTPLLLVEAALSTPGDGKNARDSIGREVGAGVTADVGGVGVMLQVSGGDSRGGSSHHSRAQSPDKDDWEPIIRQRTASDCQYDNVELNDLLLQFREAESLEEQGDILHYLVVAYGLNHPTGSFIEGEAVTVKDLLKDLYERSCNQKNWALVRHTAGMLGKRVEDLAKAVTDLLVRQKQVTVGVPPHAEVTITRPLPTTELRSLINKAYGSDESTAMLTQELLVYLAMFIRTEPELFQEMLRLRVGLIIQVMALELARTILCSKDQASDHLLNLSPFQMKNLLHHIMAGQEFNIGSARSGTYFISSKSTKLSKKSAMGSFLTSSNFPSNVRRDDAAEETEVEGARDRAGQWLRRRRLDGALNRVPRGFYKNMWNVLNRCNGIDIEGKVIPRTLTQEMTANELKFALEVETVLNTIPQPEYRQLVVEALMVVSLVAEQQLVDWLGDLISAQAIVHVANTIFLQDQRQQDGDAVMCCARDKKDSTPSGGPICEGAAYVCAHFYDSAPSGSFGTMSYMVRAVVCSLPCFPQDGDMDCTVS